VLDPNKRTWMSIATIPITIDSIDTLEAIAPIKLSWNGYTTRSDRLRQRRRAYNRRMPGEDRAGAEGLGGRSDTVVRDAAQAMLATLATYPSGNPPTPRELERAASAGRSSEVMSLAFWRRVKSGRLVFDSNAKVKLNDIPPRM
jgi:hypothetical protein